MKNAFKIINFILIIFCITFTLLAANKHQGNTYYYLTFSLLINALFIYTLNSKSLFFEIYLALFVWLGFWFKYTLSLVFLNGIIYDSGLDKNMLNIDKAILTSIIAILSIFLCFVFRRIVFVEKIYEINEKSFFEKVYLNNKRKVIFLFIIIFSIIAISNFNFNIYQRGFIYEHKITFVIVNFIKWMLLFGLTTFSCFFIYTDILRLKKVSLFIIVVAFMEIFLSYTSMLSRAAIMNLSTVTFSLTKYLDFIKNKKFFIIFIPIFIVFIFLLNNYISNKVRINHADEIGSYILAKEAKTKALGESKWKDYTELKKKNLTHFKVSNSAGVRPDPINMSIFVLINRWVGIESMIAVVSSNNLSFGLLFQSFKERKITKKKTFYETTFKVDWDGGKEVLLGEKRVLKGNTLPGIISFLFYTGNYYFLFISIFILVFIFSLFEILCKKISNNNMIFSSFISFMISFRLFNFGYVPKESYLFFASVLLSALLIFILSKSKFYFLNKRK